MSPLIDPVHALAYFSEHNEDIILKFSCLAKTGQWPERSRGQRYVDQAWHASFARSTMHDNALLILKFTFN